ncbi:hypothetical protein JL721_967 [Aureococcus anophagefferens]|nr:hypothetical protein JL721_967 [Aureococcus anophagefferens]
MDAELPARKTVRFTGLPPTPLAATSTSSDGGSGTTASGASRGLRKASSLRGAALARFSPEGFLGSPGELAEQHDGSGASDKKSKGSLYVHAATVPVENVAVSRTLFFRRESQRERAGSEAKRRLLALKGQRTDWRFSSSSRESTGLYAQDFLLEQASFNGLSRCVLACSGLWRFRTIATESASNLPAEKARGPRRRAAAYEAVFYVAYATCGCACLGNAVLGGAAPYHSLPASFTMAYFHVPSCLGFRFWRRMLNDPVSSGLVENLVELDNAVVGEALKATKRGLVVVCAAQVAAVALVLGAWALPAAPLPGGFGPWRPANGGLAFVRAHGLVMWSLFALVISSTIGRYRRPAAATMFERCRLLVVLNHAKLHTTGALRGVGYPYHWYLQDAVFLASGTAIVVVTVFASSKVTSKCAEIKAAARGVADARDTKTNAAAVSAVIDHHLHGATVWGETINQQKIIMIMWGFLMVALNAIIELLGANYNVRSDDRAVSFDA